MRGENCCASIFGVCRLGMALSLLALVRPCSYLESLGLSAPRENLKPVVPCRLASLDSVILEAAIESMANHDLSFAISWILTPSTVPS